MPTDRPYVICHMVSTLDGKTLGERWPKIPGQPQGSSGVFESTHETFNLGAWLVGTNTMREFAGRNLPLKKAKTRVGYDDFIARPKAQRLGIGVDAKGVLRYQTDETNGDHVVLLVTRRVSNDYLSHLRDAGVSYLVCGDRDVDLALALRKLRQHFGLKKLMLEGGGTFNGAMLAAGLIDEVSHLTVPIIDGGPDVTGIFDIPGPMPKKAATALRLVSHRFLPGGVSWCRYKVRK